MPTYTIGGKKITTSQELNDDQIDEIAREEGLLPETPEQRKQSFDGHVAPYESSFGDYAKAFAEGVGNVVAGGVKGASNIGSTLLRPFETGAENKERRKTIEQALESLGASPSGLPFKGGELAAETAGTMGAPGALQSLGITGLSRFAPAAIPAVTRALSNIPPRLLQYGQEIVGGATSGGIQAGLVDPSQAKTGAAIGGGINAALPVATGIGRMLGAQGNSLAGQIGQAGDAFMDWLGGRSRAGTILREAAGNQRPAVEAALRQSPGVPSAEAAANVLSPEFQALGQVARQAEPGRYSARDLATRDRHLGILQRLAGGGTQTETREMRDFARQQLNEVTGAERDESLERASVMGTVGREYQRLIDQAREASTAAVNRVRRMMQAQQTTREVGASVRPRDQSLYDVEGYRAEPWAGLPIANSYMDQLRVHAERAASEAADASLAAGSQARGYENRLQELRDMGLQELNVSQIIRNIMRTANSPGIRANPVYVETLTDVAESMFAGVRAGGGVMHPLDLYELRKSGINQIINKVLSKYGMNPDTESKMVAQLLGDIRPQIDRAITQAAGSRGWINYLNRYSQGARAIDQREMASQLLDLYQTDPGQFLSIVEGNEDKIVEKLFGPGHYSLQEMMTPQQLREVRSIANDLRRTQYMRNQAMGRTTEFGGIESGMPALQTILENNRPAVTRLMGLIGPKGKGIEAMVDMVRNQISDQTRQDLLAAAANSTTALELMQRMPSSSVREFLQAIAPAAETATRVGLSQ
jgi:hypothetical protein